MGLDMYLYRDITLFDDDTEGAKRIKECIRKELPEVKNDITIREEVMYWRKANQIHNWFVENVQGGEDNAQPHWVPYEKLKELYETIKYVLEKRDEEVAMDELPPVAGFFFGSTNIDEYYWDNLEYTKKKLEELFKEYELLTKKGYTIDYYYDSSW